MKLPRPVLFTKAELMAWRTYSDPAWEPFKRAWWNRGFRRPPTAKQRVHLWAIADARPNDLGRWTKEAPGSSAEEVITYIFDRWRNITSRVFDANPNEYLPHPRDPVAPKRLGEIMRASMKESSRNRD